MNQKLLQQLKPESVEVDIIRVEEPDEAGLEESELDGMWSYVGKKSNSRWLRHAIDEVNVLPEVASGRTLTAALVKY